jgi:hypothetical protein
MYHYCTCELCVQKKRLHACTCTEIREIKSVELIALKNYINIFFVSEKNLSLYTKQKLKTLTVLLIIKGKKI